MPNLQLLKTAPSGPRIDPGQPEREDPDKMPVQAAGHKHLKDL